MSQQQLNPKRFDYPVTTSEVAPKAALSEEDIGRPVTKEDAADVQSLEAQIIGKVSKNRSRSQFTPHLLVLLSIVISLTTPVHHTSGWLQVTTSGLFGLKTLAETSSKVTSLSGEHTLHTLSVPKKNFPPSSLLYGALAHLVISPVSQTSKVGYTSCRQSAAYRNVDPTGFNWQHP